MLYLVTRHTFELAFALLHDVGIVLEQVAWRKNGNFLALGLGLNQLVKLLEL